MTKEWSEEALQQYIDDQTEESLTLEYKAAGSIAKLPDAKTEITKDVSAMANSAGGTIIYGISEYSLKDKKHLPEKITPISRTQFSKEWLEQVIHNIRPRISELIIHPVTLSSGPDDVAYVVEIPQSTTAHQATDKKYYMRFNFLAEAMDHYQILDIISRQSKPDASVEFGFERLDRNVYQYILKVYVTNNGTQVIHNFQLEFTWPKVVAFMSEQIVGKANMDLNFFVDYLITYRSKSVLYPNEKRDIGKEMRCQYEMDPAKYSGLQYREFKQGGAFVEWTLYADNMIPKKGKTPFHGNFHDF